MALNSDHHTQKITISKKTVKITNTRDDIDYPKATKKDGKYILPWECVDQSPTALTNFKYFFTIDESRVPNEKKLNDEPLMQLMTADPNRVENPPENGIRTTWLGHASVLFQLDNVNILVNPNFNARGTKYYHPGDNKRYRQPVYSVADLPRIDCVFITNTHFDYLDLSSVRMLNERFGEMILWYVPMGVCDWMNKAGCVNVVELDWWKEDEVDFIDHTKLGEEDEETKTTTFNIACTPSQNYHSRDIADDNGALWCSWVVISPRYKLFLAGATGYNETIFKSIGRRYGPFHMAALPIGGYSPAWKFAFSNTTPEQAVQIHQDVLAMCSLALSWGTFTVSNEYYLEPPQRLNDELRSQGLSEMQFFLLKHGESRLIEIKEADKDDHLDDEPLENHVDATVETTVETENHVDVTLNGHAHVDLDVPDVPDADAAVTITTTETVVTTDGDFEVPDMDSVTTTETTTVTTGVDVDGDGEIDTFVTTTETTVVEGETEQTELTVDDIPNLDVDVNFGVNVEVTTETTTETHSDDADVLQQLVDQFVDDEAK